MQWVIMMMIIVTMCCCCCFGLWWCRYTPVLLLLQTTCSLSVLGCVVFIYTWLLLLSDHCSVVSCSTSPLTPFCFWHCPVCRELCWTSDTCCIGESGAVGHEKLADWAYSNSGPLGARKGWIRAFEEPWLAFLTLSSWHLQPWWAQAVRVGGVAADCSWHKDTVDNWSAGTAVDVRCWDALTLDL